MEGMEDEKEVGNIGSNMRQKMEIVKSLKLRQAVVMKGKPYKYWMKIFGLSKGKTGYISNLEVYAGAIPSIRNTVAHSML